MYVLGLTGGSGCGKSRLAEALRTRGATVLDADEIYHTLTEKRSACTEELANAFGDGILNRDGSLNRPALAAVVFSGDDAQSDRLARLNAITHKHVRAEFLLQMERCRKSGCRFLVLDVPLLFESEMDTLCDRVAAVIAPRELRISRIMARDSLTEARAAARIDAQPSDAFYRARAAVTVENNGDIKRLLTAADALASEAYEHC